MEKIKHKKNYVKVVLLILVIGLLLSACGKSSEDSMSYIDNSNQNGTMLDDNEERTDENNANQPLHKTDVSEGYIGIYTVDDLINSSKNESANYILMNDLDLSSVSDWEGIRNEGIFDGNNYVIKNLNSTNGGLFAHAKNLMNFKLEEINININVNAEPEKLTNIHIGGLVDWGHVVNNCEVSGNITFSAEPIYYDADLLGIKIGPESEKYCVGGIMGSQAVDGTPKITNCTNNTTINVENKGAASSDNETYVGGILGYGRYSILIDCKNYGRINVVSKDSQFTIAGGICGCSKECYRDSNYGEVFSSGVSGGIIGILRGDNTIDSCYNSGSIVSKKHQSSGCNYNGETKGSCSGGIGGYVERDGVLITNSYNVGKCNGADNCGAIVGGRYDYEGLDIKYCAYCNEQNIDITGDSAMFADNKAMTIEEMKKLNNYPFNNKDSVWKNGTGDYPYPVINYIFQ